MIGDLSAVVNRLASGSYTVKRQSTVMVGPRRQNQLTETLTILASVQPTNGRMVNLLPEGTRLEDTKVMFTATRLQLSTDPDKDPDLVDLGAEGWFKAIGQAEWNDLAGFYQVLLERVKGSTQ